MRRKRTGEPFDPYVPPSYPTNKEFQPDEGELEALGATSVATMVAEVNRYWKSLKRHPLSQYDYPTNRAKFQKLVGWWKDAQASIAAKNKAPATA